MQYLFILMYLFLACAQAIKQCNTFPVGYRGDDDIEFKLVAISPAGTTIAVAGSCKDTKCGADLPNPVIEYYSTSN